MRKKMVGRRISHFSPFLPHCERSPAAFCVFVAFFRKWWQRASQAKSFTFSCVFSSHCEMRTFMISIHQFWPQNDCSLQLFPCTSISTVKSRSHTQSLWCMTGVCIACMHDTVAPSQPLYIVNDILSHAPQSGESSHEYIVKEQLFSNGGT